MLLEQRRGRRKRWGMGFAQQQQANLFGTTLDPSSDS